MNLMDYFLSNEDRPMIHKPLRYFPVYEKHFARFRHKDVRVLEIGVENGGSLLMWKNYFGAKSEVVGIDINPKCKEFETNEIKIYIGDQADEEFLNSFLEEEICFDIIIDDGGHMMKQQITSFKALYGKGLSANGIYLIEDCGTSYWQPYGGGLRNPNSFIEYMKGIIDEVNQQGMKTVISSITQGITFYSDIVVVERGVVMFDKSLAIGIKKI